MSSIDSATTTDGHAEDSRGVMFTLLDNYFMWAYEVLVTPDWLLLFSTMVWWKLFVRARLEIKMKLANFAIPGGLTGYLTGIFQEVGIDYFPGFCNSLISVHARLISNTESANIQLVFFKNYFLIEYQLPYHCDLIKIFTHP